MFQKYTLKNQHRHRIHHHYRLIEHQTSTQSSPSHIESLSSSYNSGHHHHCLHCPYNNSPLQSPTSNRNLRRSKLTLNLQKIKHLNEMIQRQRSASHCPHTAINIGTDFRNDSMNKCCCCQKARNISSAENNNRNNSASSLSKNIGGGSSGGGGGGGGNIVVDPLRKKMVQQHDGGGGLSTPSSQSSSSNNNHGRQKRASSLRVLNRRFNFFDTTNSTNFNNKMDDTTIIGGGRGGSSRRGSRNKHNKRQPIKLMDLNDECFITIFEFLSLQEKLYYERVCHRWQHLIRRSLQSSSSASLKIGEHSVKCNCQCSHYISWDLPPSKNFPRDQIGYIIYPKSTLKYLLTLCNQLKCINFSHCYLDDETLQVKFVCFLSFFLISFQQ